MKDLLSKAIRRSSIANLQNQEEHGPKLSRVLSAWDLFVAGFGCIIGAGIFVLTGVAAAQHAGPGIIISFALAGALCALVAMAYAELASMIPVAGSAYTYARASLGELISMLIGWDLILEYNVGASGVAVGWSGYLQAMLKEAGITLPTALSHAPASIPWGSLLLTILLVGGAFLSFRRAYQLRFATMFDTGWQCPHNFTFLGIVLSIASFWPADTLFQKLESIDLLAVLIVMSINVLLILGVKMAARATFVLVILQALVIVLFIGLGSPHIDPANYSDFLPFGFGGVLTGAAIVFFAYIGFDSVTTLAEECKDPQRDLPRGILSSLIVCTILYMVMAAVMTGAAHYSLLGTEAPVTEVLKQIGSNWAIPIIAVGVIAGLTSTLLVLLLGQSRVLMRMSKDGLLPPALGKINHRFRTPATSIMLLGALVSICAGLLPIEELAELCNIGTLAAFVVVCLGVVILRYQEPERARKFLCPGMPWLPIVGAISCVALMVSLPMQTWIRFLGWMILGMIIWIFYGSKHSKLNDLNAEPSKSDQG